MQIIILGMHRSGTSCVARLVNMMGAYFSPEGREMATHIHNQKGFWERLDVMQLNDDILISAGGTWDQVSQLDFGKIDNEQRESIKKRIQSIVLRMDEHKPWFVKDPRFCLVLSEWMPLLEVPVFLIVYRNPIQIAQSLKKRDGIPLFVGVALWEYYIVSALVKAKGTSLIFTHYEDVMMDPVSEVEKIYGKLQEHGVIGLQIPKEEKILSFVKPDLYHNRGDSNFYPDYLNRNQLDLIEIIKKNTKNADFSRLKVCQCSIEIINNYYLNENHLKQKKKAFAIIEQDRDNIERELNPIFTSLKVAKKELAEISENDSQLSESLEKILEKKNKKIDQMQLALLREFIFGDFRLITKLSEQYSKVPGWIDLLSTIKLKLEWSIVDNIVDQLENSGLFDANYYLAENPDIQRLELNPLKHFIIHGVFEGRKPNEFFDPIYYLHNFPDVISKGINPLYHYHLYGWKEGYNPSQEFDTKYYLNSNPDVRENGINPLTHFLAHRETAGEHACPKDEV